MTIRWVTAFLDTAEESAEEVETFWSRVTGHVLSAAARREGGVRQPAPAER